MTAASAALPVSTAVRRAARLAPTCVVVSVRSSSCHLYVVSSGSAGPLTAAGTVPPGGRPACGQGARRWRGVVESRVGELPLCLRCAAWVSRRSPFVAPTLGELVDALRTARRLVEVEQLVLLAAWAGLSTELVFSPGVGAAGTFPLHRVVAAARDRIAPPGREAPRPSWPMASIRTGELTARGRAVLAFERLHWRRPGARDAAVRDLFDLSPTRYAQQLNVLLDFPAALRAEPTVVHRLRRLRDSRRRQRHDPSVIARPPAGPLLPVRSATA